MSIVTKSFTATGAKHALSSGGSMRSDGRGDSLTALCQAVAKLTREQKVHSQNTVRRTQIAVTLNLLETYFTNCDACPDAPRN